MFCPRTTAFLAVCLVGGCFAEPALAQAPTQNPFPLFNGKNFSGWYKYSGDKKVKAEELIIMDPFEKHIIIKGTAKGYLMTDKPYGDYELSFEWRWALPDRDKPAVKPEELKRDSGILFHIAGEGDLIWPKSIQIQLQAERAGDLYVLNGFKLNANPERIDPKNKSRLFRLHDGIERPLGEWNSGVLTCHGKFVSMSINGTMVVAGRDPEYTKGRIALQSEAGEIHFRNINMKKLEGKPVDPEKDN